MMPTWCGALATFAATTNALTTSSDAIAGYSGGTYPLGVPSLRTDPIAMTRSPILISGCAAPHVPTRRNVWTPSSPSSSTAIATEGPVLAAESDLFRVVKELGDHRGAPGIAWHEDVLADISWSQPDVVFLLVGRRH